MFRQRFRQSKVNMFQISPSVELCSAELGQVNKKDRNLLICDTMDYISYSQFRGLVASLPEYSLQYSTAVQSRKAVCANFNHNRYFHYTSVFGQSTPMVKDRMDIIMLNISSA